MGMKAEELMIGNLVQDGEDGRIGSVLQIHAKKLVVKMSHSTLIASIDDFEPIHLTEEWLIKLGFEVDWSISHKEEHFNMFVIGDEYVYTADMHHHTSEPFKYVHQLQNLHFALTGKHLQYLTEHKENS